MFGSAFRRGGFRAALVSLGVVAFATTPVSRAATGDTPSAEKQSAAEASAAIPKSAQGAVNDANDTVNLFKKTDPGLEGFFKNAAGYAVFPSVGKGAFIVGGAHGSGILFEGGQPVGETSLTQGTVGLQVGGQAYAEIIFFETEQVLRDFKKGTFAFSGQVSAVVLAAGAAANAKYRWGVAVFTAAKGGLMVEASLGGQKFSYTAFEKEKSAKQRESPKG